jgi:rRNA maturation endonuclease Nob1
MRIGLPELIIIFALIAGLGAMAIFVRRVKGTVAAGKACPTCGRPLAADSNICRECGSPKVPKAI